MPWSTPGSGTPDEFFAPAGRSDRACWRSSDMSSLGPLSAEALVPEPGVGTAGMLPEGGEAYHSGSAWRMIAAVFLENRLAIVGLGMIIFVTLFSFVGPFIYRTQQVFDNPNIANHAPSLAHPLGTDALGYDVLGRIMLGGQSSLEIGFAAALIAIGIGVVWGAASGLAGGIIDTVMMRIVDAMLAIPFLFALIVLGAIFTTSILELIIVIGLVAWLVPAR